MHEKHGHSALQLSVTDYMLVKICLSDRLNCPSDSSESRNWIGRLFHVRGPTAANERSPNSVFIGTVLYKTKSLDGTKPNTNPKTNPIPNTNPIQLFYAFEHGPIIFKLDNFVRFSHRSNTVPLPLYANTDISQLATSTFGRDFSTVIIHHFLP